MEKVIDLEDRIPSLRQRRKRRTNIKFILLTTVFVIALAFLFYLQSSISKIQSFDINGTYLQDEQYYIEQSHIHIGSSMWGFQPKEVEEKLASLEWVKSVEVKRNLLTEVEINIVEYEKMAYIKEGEHYKPLLENGEVFDVQKVTYQFDAPIATNFEEEPLRKRLVKTMMKIDPSILTMISQIVAHPTEADPYGIVLYMNDGYEVRANLTTLSDKIDFYPSIIAQIEHDKKLEKGIIDIEVGTYYQSYNVEYGDGLVQPEESDEQAVEQMTSEEPVTNLVPIEETIIATQ